jgi:hypothetical protein
LEPDHVQALKFLARIAEIRAELEAAEKPGEGEER